MKPAGHTRTTISMTPGLYERALARMAAREFSTFSDYVQALIRDDLEAAGAFRPAVPGPLTQGLAALGPATPAPAPAGSQRRSPAHK